MQKPNLVGKRVKLIEMVDDPCPIEPGSEGEIVWQGGGILNVQWDSGRRLGLSEDIDKYEILES